MKLSNIVKFCALAVSVIPAVQATANTILVEDSFSLNGTTREAGSLLDGQLAETYQSSGSGRWIITTSAPDKAVFSSSGTIVSATNGFGIEARIALTPLPQQILSVSSNLMVGDADWLGIGFAPEALSGQQLFTAGQSSLWVLLRPNGGVQVFTNGTSQTLFSGSVRNLGGGFKPDEFYTITLSYNPTDELAQLVIVDNVSNTFETDWFATGSIPAIGAAAFKINGQSATAGAAQFNSFSVTSVPEPKHAVLLLGGLLAAGVIAIRVRKSRVR